MIGTVSDYNHLTKYLKYTLNFFLFNIDYTVSLTTSQSITPSCHDIPPCTKTCKSASYQSCTSKKRNTEDKIVSAKETKEERYHIFFSVTNLIQKLKLELPSIIHSEYECKIQNVMAIFPNRSSLEMKQYLSITNGDVNDAIQLMLVESENEPPFSLNGQKQCQAVHPQVTLYQEFNDLFRFYLLHALELCADGVSAIWVWSGIP